MRAHGVAPVAWSIAAIAALAWVLIALGFASLGPSQFVPHIFSSYHIEHFIAFYVVAVLAAAGLSRVKLLHLGAGLAVLATLLEGVRLLIPQHRLSSGEDLLADLGGISAAFLPILIGRLRGLTSEIDGAPTTT